MSLRIPLTPDQTLQTEFHEIERRLRKLERSVGESGSTTKIVAIGGGRSTVTSPAAPDLTEILDRLSQLEATVASLDTDTTVSEFRGVGSSAAAGTVPSPGINAGPTGVAEHVLKEDATWGFPLRGLIGVTTDGATDATDSVEVLGGLHVNASLSADEVVTRKVTAGVLILPGVLATSEDELSVAGLA